MRYDSSTLQHVIRVQRRRWPISPHDIQWPLIEQYMCVCVYKANASVYMSSMRARLFLVIRVVKLLSKINFSRHRDILSFERESARQRFRECWKANLQD